MSFKRLDSEDFVISADAISSTLWSTNSPALTAFFTASTGQVDLTNGNYYIDVYQTSKWGGYPSFTTTKFSEKAIEEAKFSNIKLIDGAKLIALCQKYQHGLKVRILEIYDADF